MFTPSLKRLKVCSASIKIKHISQPIVYCFVQAHAATAARLGEESPGAAGEDERCC